MNPRQNTRYLDLTTGRIAPRTHRTAPGSTNWARLGVYALAVAFSLSIWACLFLAVLYWRD